MKNPRGKTTSGAGKVGIASGAYSTAYVAQRVRNYTTRLFLTARMAAPGRVVANLPSSAAMNATILNFLTTDGAVTVSFEKSLTPYQYDALYSLIHGQHYTTDELCNSMKSLANEWDVVVHLDNC